MTATNNGLAFDLAKLFRLVPEILIPLWWPGEGIVKFEHRADVIGESHRDALTNRKITNKSFFNQSTLVVRRAVGGMLPPKSPPASHVILLLRVEVIS